MSKCNFVAIDFETMTAERTSACALGMVKVLNNVIVEKSYLLINPIPDDRTDTNIFVHGINASMVQEAPTFKESWTKIVDFIGTLPLVCHNRGMDIVVMNRCMEYYDLDGLNTSKNYCTYEITRESLMKACKRYNISFSENEHHDALADAEACAKVFLATKGIHEEVCVEKINDYRSGGFGASHKINHEDLCPLDPNEVENKDTPFFQAKVLITGVFEEYPERAKLAAALKLLGANVNTSLSRRTNIVLKGKAAGPKKMEKLEKLKREGYDIRVICEAELVGILGDID